MTKHYNRHGLIALSPLLVFILMFLSGGIISGDFYKMPITVAFMVASIYAVAVCGRYPLSKRIQVFSRGAGSENLLLMLWIYVLAGAFAASAKEMGSIDATVGVALRYLPPGLLLPGLFLAACFISISIGTSVGTVVALVPIAAGVAAQAGTGIPLTTAVVVGGAYFGDNLSFISDTTVAATQSMGVKMSDKFRVNFLIVLPAAILILAIYTFMGMGTKAPVDVPEVSLVKVLPYVLVLVTAVCGMNVMAVLTLGLLCCGVIGMIDGSYDIFGWFQSMGKGITSMGELVIVAMLAGGMLEIINENGGIEYLIKKLTARVSGRRGAEFSIAMLVSLVNVCTANNTVAIITVGGISRSISEKFGVDPRKAASILDTFSCTVQGLLPYGVQMLLAAGLAHISPMQIVPYLYYPMAIGLAGLVAIVIRYPRRFS